MQHTRITRFMPLTQPAAVQRRQQGHHVERRPPAHRAVPPAPLRGFPVQLTSESTFLNLLVAQIQNQDPLNPTDSIQFVGQLVQFSQLEQLLSINQGVTTLAGGCFQQLGNFRHRNTSGTGGTSGTTPHRRKAKGRSNQLNKEHSKCQDHSQSHLAD